MKTLAVVTSVGCRTCVGLSAKETALSYRAGAAGMTEAAILDENDEPFTMCLLPTLDPLLAGPGRAVWLGLPALAEALAPLGQGLGSLRSKLVLCLDEHLAVAEAGGLVPASIVVGMVQKRLGELGAAAMTIEPCVRGPAGLGFALQDDLAALAASTLDVLVVGGLHSDYDPKRLRALDEQGRLFKPENLDSMIPGEAAAFAVLVRPDVARRSGLPVWAQLHALETAFERARPDNDEPAFVAAGLTTAVRKVGALLTENQRKAGWILTDLTFEMWRVNEWMSVWSRATAFVGDPNYLDSPAQRMGNLGAAAMPLHLVLAAEGWRRGFAPSAVALSFAGSDTGERAAMLLSAPPG